MQDHVDEQVRQLKHRHGKLSEIKWREINVTLAEDLLNLFLATPELLFGCVAISTRSICITEDFAGSKELALYRFYHELLTRELLRNCGHKIYIDQIGTRRVWLPGVQATLARARPDCTIYSVDELDSKASLYIQFVDVLTGLVQSALNGRVSTEDRRYRLVSHCEKHVGNVFTGDPFVTRKFSVHILSNMEHLALDSKSRSSQFDVSRALFEASTKRPCRKGAQI